MGRAFSRYGPICAPRVRCKVLVRTLTLKPVGGAADTSAVRSLAARQPSARQDAPPRPRRGVLLLRRAAPQRSPASVRPAHLLGGRRSAAQPSLVLLPGHPAHCVTEPLLEQFGAPVGTEAPLRPRLLVPSVVAIEATRPRGARLADAHGTVERERYDQESDRPVKDAL